jgi:hypothetical protein
LFLFTLAPVSPKMVDPITAITAATAAFNGVKKLVAAGKDIEDTFGQLSQWYQNVADIHAAEEQNKNLPLFKKLTNSQSIETEALNIFAAKKKIQAQEKELREMVLYSYGQDAWREMIQLRRRIKAEREQAILAQKKKQEKVFWNTIYVAFLTGLAYGIYAMFKFLAVNIKGE